MHKPLSYAALLLVSQLPLQALADTDVYLTNNGPEPLQLAISQSGSGQLQLHRGREQGIGRPVAAHEAALTAKAREELRRTNSVRLFGPDESSGIVSFTLDGVHPHDLGTILDEDGVAIRAGHHCAQPLLRFFNLSSSARASLGVYNTADDIIALGESLRRAVHFFE